MKRTASVFVFLVIFLIGMGASFSSAGAGKKVKKIDTKVTLDLYKEWATRDKFPDSIPFAYYSAYSLLALEGKIAPDTKGKIISFIKKCQRPDGGFVTIPKYATDSNIIFTYYALETLDLLKALDSIDGQKTLEFILACVQKDGGIKARPVKKEKAGIDSTYYGVLGLERLQKLDKIEAKKTIAFVNAYKEKGMGFSKVLKMRSTPGSTFMATRILKTLDGLNPQVKKEVVAYYKSTRYSGLVKDKKYRLLPNIKDMSYTIAGLADLSALAQADTRKMHEFVESLYVADNGGFGPRPGLGTTPSSTYYGVFCLVKLGDLREPSL